MKKVGEILYEERIRQGISIEEVSEATRIRVEFVRALEEGKYSDLPNEVYVRGFIQEYATYLGLEPSQVLPFYRRESKGTGEEGKPADIPKPINQSGIKLTPSRIVATVVSLGLTVFILFLFVQYRTFADAPILIIDFPAGDIVTEQSQITILGKTDPDVSVTVNGEEVDVLMTGEFSVDFELTDGINRIRVVAINQLGGKRIVERLVEKREIEPTPIPTPTDKIDPLVEPNGSDQ